jgi:predicted PolB exonuclease-like 3'-5' exonuclease
MAVTPAVKFLVFDVESVADGALVSKVRYPGENLAPADAIRKYRDELLAKYETDFIPYTFQFPISVVVAKVASDLRLIDLVALDDPEFRPHVIAEHFWRGWEVYKRPTLVSFNGRSFDVPLLELAAFRYGLNLQRWFNVNGRTYEQPRNRYNTEAHLDVYDVLTNFGAARFNGGLNLAASILGKPGKMEVQGHMVQDLYDDGKLAEINDYCRCDVLDTYFVFLRSCVLLGNISLTREQELVDAAQAWLQERSETSPAYAAYLERWGDWTNPWQDSAAPS